MMTTSGKAWTDMPKKPSLLKPSGNDVVIRNSLAIKKLNRQMAKLDPEKQTALIDEKDRLMHEMWAACRHESVVYNPGMKTRIGPDPLPLRFCTSCGFDEASPTKKFKVLVPRRGRAIVRLEGQEFSIRLGETLRRTGINL